MEAFEYARPASGKEALELLGGSFADSEILAGGMDLISLMKNYVLSPKRLVNIKGISEFSGIRSTQQGLAIGATTTLQELIEHKTIAADYPGLHQAADAIPSPQIRNMATAGGNLCQRPRCWYFRNGFGLLARDAKGNPLVPGGDNRYHAIFGNDGPAYFVNGSSLAPALIALSAQARIFSANGWREVAVADFFRTPRNDNERENVLQPKEILGEIVIPSASKGLRTSTYEVREREALDWPLATASVALKMSGNKIEKASVVLGYVAPIPWQAKEAGDWLAGKTLNEETAAKAGEAAVQGAKPLSGNKYKVQLARVCVKRALLAAGRA
ncbi:MAG: xanthine dehydrogenase family protein subunit M [Acidipila sp.]|nr:xanthine dehydrogenase family protein subunit M [Acidipila sp.]